MPRKKYNVLSPDGFSIHPTNTYTSRKAMMQAFTEWKQRYTLQGYYSSTAHGRIDLLDLEDFCQFIEL